MYTQTIAVYIDSLVCYSSTVPQVYIRTCTTVFSVVLNSLLEVFLQKIFIIIRNCAVLVVTGRLVSFLEKQSGNGTTG